MILDDIKKELLHAKNVTITSRYIILYRGVSVAIYDYNFACQKRILNLKYVYTGYVSPDEKKLLLVSNINRYYVFSLENFSLITTHSIKKPYNGNLEGIACWCSNDSFILPIQNTKSMLSTIRKFDCISSSSIEDYLADTFWINHITFIEQKNSCLIIGFNRHYHAWNIIWMDMHGKYTTYRILDFDEAVLGIDICYDTERIVLTGESKIYCCNFYGIPSNIWGNHSTAPIIDHYFPTFFQISPKDPSIAYLGTTDSLIVYNLKEHNTIRSYHLEFGARSVKEFGKLLFVSSYDGLHLISLSE